MKFNFPVLGFISAIMISCSPNYYLPTKQNVMVFEKKGDIIVSGNLGLGHGQKGVEAGYAFTNNIGLYSSFNGFDISNNGNSAHLINDFIWDNELIVFKTLNRVYASVNLGVGLGKINVNNPYYDLGLSRQFVQPTLGITFSHFDFAFSTRFTRLGYKLKPLISNMTDYDYYMFNNYFDFLEIDKQNYYFVEPAFTCGISYEYFKLHFQYTMANKSGKDAYFYISENLTTSISLNIDKIFFKKADNTKKLRWTF